MSNTNENNTGENMTGENDTDLFEFLDTSNSKVRRSLTFGTMRATACGWSGCGSPFSG